MLLHLQSFFDSETFSFAKKPTADQGEDDKPHAGGLDALRHRRRVVFAHDFECREAAQRHLPLAGGELISMDENDFSDRLNLSQST